MYERTKWEGGIFYIKSTPDSEWRRAGEARQEAEVKALMEENERLREWMREELSAFEGWDDAQLKKRVAGEAFERIRRGLILLQDKSSGV